VLHAGDLSDASVLRALGGIAPVLAVRGDHDRALGATLPRARVVRVAGHRIGVTHGRRARLVEAPAVGLSLLAGRERFLGLHRALRRRFADVDCVVYGHLHRPCCVRQAGVLFVCPGAVCVPERDATYDWRSLRGQGYLRFRRGLEPSAWRPSVAIIEATRSRLEARIVPLDAV
jgi:putative phosphoesterase